MSQNTASDRAAYFEGLAESALMGEFHREALAYAVLAVALELRAKREHPDGGPSSLSPEHQALLDRLTKPADLKAVS